MRRTPSLGRCRIARIAIKAIFIIAAAFALPVLLLRWLPPPVSAVMIEKTLAHRSDANFSLRYDWVPAERISPHIKAAVIASEDQRFFEHFGFDFKALTDAYDSYRNGGKLRGASTISQQTAKNVFLWTSRSLIRKGLEAWLTLLIELLWPKERILEVYLNVAEFGHGTFGVEAAAQRYFRKPASALTRHEAALLAAVLPSPLRFRVENPSEYVLARRDWILYQMNRLGGSRYLLQIQ
jgi:monofunctional biosynthetic peptidoglycan transglycosylase